MGQIRTGKVTKTFDIIHEHIIQCGDLYLCWKYGTTVLEYMSWLSIPQDDGTYSYRGVILLSTDLEEHIPLFHAFHKNGPLIQRALFRVLYGPDNEFRTLGWNFREDRPCVSVTLRERHLEGTSELRVKAEARAQQLRDEEGSPEE